jgi:hypothetical protein
MGYGYSIGRGKPLTTSLPAMTITPQKLIIGGLVTVIGACALLTAINRPKSIALPPAAATPESVAQENELKVRWACEDAIKAKLNDPKSYEARDVQTLSATDATNATWIQVRVDFGARNGFGGMVSSKAVCNFDRNAQLIASAIA